jgi:hypothetical protein
MTKPPGLRSVRMLLLEALVIVASILAAFALDRWWDVREAEREQQRVLSGLRSEFRQAKAELEQYRDSQRRIQVSVSSILTALRAARARNARFASVPDTSLGWAYIPPTARPSLGTLAGLLASARLGVVRDPALRNALAGWDGVFDDLAEEEAECRVFVMDHLDPVLRARLDVSAFRNIILHYLDGSLAGDRIGGMTRLPADPEVVGVFATRLFYLHHGIDEYGPVLEHVDRILRLIDDSARGFTGAE